MSTCVITIQYQYIKKSYQQSTYRLPAWKQINHSHQHGFLKNILHVF